MSALSEAPARVLLVDDEPNVLSTLAPIFVIDGYQVDVAESGAEARRAIADSPYDVVVTDLRLGDADGLDIVDTLQQERPGTPAIVLTGFASLESAVDAMHRGAFDYLLKPCDVDELRATVRRAVSHHRISRELRERVAVLETSGAQPTIDAISGLVAELDTTKRELELALGRERATVARLRELDDLKSQFISNVSHELRTPLTSIRGYAALLAKRLGGADDNVQNSLQAISRATDQLRRLIEDLLDIAAIESGRLRVSPEEVDLVEAIGAATQMVGPMATEKSLSLVSNVAPDLPRVLADATRLSQVLNNLLTNAVKFTNTGGTITVEARKGAGLAHVSVNDTGVGIPKDEQAHIFSRFFHASSAPQSHQRGLGLGLAISRAIIEAHSGAIWLESEPGVGTTVHFTLPVARA